MATPGTTPLLHAVTRPRRTWQGLGAGAKLAVYSRLSLQLLVVVCGVGVIVLALVGRSGDGPTITSAQLLLVAVPTIVLTVMGLWITELRPEFNTSPRAEHGRLLVGTAVVADVLVHVAAVDLHFVGLDGQHRQGAGTQSPDRVRPAGQ